MAIERAVYVVEELDDEGILVDVLGPALDCLSRRMHAPLKWTVFNLNWRQRDDGTLQWERVIRRSGSRPEGWRLDDHGIRFFHSQCRQVVDGLFLAAPAHIKWHVGATAEALMLMAEIGLQALDGSAWLLTCHDSQLAEILAAPFPRARRVVLAG